MEVILLVWGQCGVYLVKVGPKIANILKKGWSRWCIELIWGHCKSTDIGDPCEVEARPLLKGGVRIMGSSGTPERCLSNGGKLLTKGTLCPYRK